MDIPQLRLSAGLVRALLEQHDVPVGHAQSLDLIAALPGLRNWPEVNAFAHRVGACNLDQTSCARLAHRLKSKHALVLSPQSILEALRPPVTGPAAVPAPAVWPSGPVPGVYLTTSQDAIDALLKRYEEATDGEVVYAEAAGAHWHGSIDLGQYGLSSSGLSRVPSGTLIVVGPLELNQESWGSSAEKLGWACMRVQSSGHRVAVLIDTPAPAQMFKDIELMLEEAAQEDPDIYKALAGVVSEEGALALRQPFAGPTPTAVALACDAPLDVVAQSVLPDLRRALSRRSTGILAFGSSIVQEHRAIDLIAAMLPLTDAVGPAARIKQRNRSTPEKDMMVPDAVKVLPFLPSVESAYAHGYRRMIVESSYTDVDTMVKYGDEVLFMMGSYGFDATNAFLETARFRSFDKLDQVLGKLIAAVGVGVMEVKGQKIRIGDLFVPGQAGQPLTDDFGVLSDFVSAGRTVRWEDELDKLLASKQVSLADIKSAFKRQLGMEDFFATRKQSPVRRQAQAKGG